MPAGSGAKDVIWVYKAGDPGRAEDFPPAHAAIIPDLHKPSSRLHLRWPMNLELLYYHL